MVGIGTTRRTLLGECGTGRRKISNRELRWIAEGRMRILLGLAESAGLAGNMGRSRRYLQLARSISMRTKTPMPPGFLYCKGCENLLIPGSNCRVRLRSNRVVVHCLTCGEIRRRPYLERKGARNDGEEK